MELKLDDPIVIAALLLAGVADLFTILGYAILLFPIIGIPMFVMFVMGANLVIALVLGIWFIVKTGAINESLKLQKEMMSGVGGALAAGMEGISAGLSYVALGIGLFAGLVLPVKAIGLGLAVVLTNKAVQKAAELAIQVGIAVGTGGTGAVVEAGVGLAAKEGAAIAAKEVAEGAVEAGVKTAAEGAGKAAVKEEVEQGIGQRIKEEAKERAKDRLLAGDDAKHGDELTEDFGKTDIDRLGESMQNLPEWGKDDVSPLDKEDGDEREAGEKSA